MEQRYLIDTNVLIDAQMGKISENGIKFITEVINKNFTVSFVSYIEFRGYKNISPQSEEFISMANVIEINKIIIDICITLRRKNRIDLPDAIIAATALAENLVIVTRNLKDFATIEGLNIINPHNL